MHQFNRKQTEDEIAHLASEIANQAVRESLLDDVVNSYFQEKLVDITGQSLGVLKQSWRPFRANFSSSAGFGLHLEIGDPLVHEIMVEQNLWEEAFDIAMRSFIDAIFELSPEFFTMILNDLLIEDKPSYEVINENE